MNPRIGRRHLILLLLLAAPFASVAKAVEGGLLRMATTTSTENSGLLDYLLPAFEEESGMKVHVIAVGTGKALRMGDSGDVDLVLVHAPDAELAYLKRGAFVNRRTLMHNYFVLAGPPSDPAGAGQMPDILAALRRIAAARAIFVSRGDRSGTHTKELALWKAAQTEPAGGWYREVGQGMGRTLTIANEIAAYVLSDEATFHAFGSRLDLKILSKQELLLRNVYSAMAVNPAKHPHVQYQRALRLIDWLASPRGQRAIAAYRRGGRRLFTPALPTAR